MNEKQNYIRLLSSTLYLFIGVVSVYLFVRNANFYEIKENIAGADLRWYIVIVITTTLGYMVRCARWNMLIKSAGGEATVYASFISLSIGYFVNLALPRVGEFTRCATLQQKKKISFAALIGTVITERLVDLICLILMLIATYAMQSTAMKSFYNQNIIEPLSHTLQNKMSGTSTLFWLIIVLTIIVSVYIFIKVLRPRLPDKLNAITRQVMDGIGSIMKIKQPMLFVFYSMLIWSGYYFMTWFWLQAFDETSNNSWGLCLSIISIGSVGRTIPIQGGGMGAYHFLVEKVAAAYNIAPSMGKTIAIVVHAGQMIYTTAIGIVCYIIFMGRKKSNKP
ncbi:MAG: flippase-like domain-containing protein [Bacteroidetes bacterium]|nr:flippase-like domain-containing protein [Bacteroidota bacterium]